MEISTNLTKSDLISFSNFHFRRKRFKKIAIGGIILVLVLSLYITSVFKIEFSAQIWVFIFFVFGYSLLFFSIIFLGHFFRTRYAARKAAFLGERKYFFLDDHIVVETAEVNSTVKWSAIRSVDVGKTAFYLYMDINAALLIPFRSIGDKQAQNDFLQLIRAHVKG